MKILKVGAAALNQTPMDWAVNISNIRKAILKASEELVDILCLPELCITGYGCEDQFLSEDLHTRAEQALKSLVEDVQLKYLNIVYTVGLPVVYNGFIYNCAAVISKGEILAVIAKQFLAGDGIHYENRWFKAGQHLAGLGSVYDSIFKSMPKKVVAFGAGKVLDLQNIKIGFEICEDAWVSNRPGISLFEAGVDIILNPSASHFSFGKQESREALIKYASKAYSCVYVYSNLLGCESGRAIYDGSCIIASNGKIVAKNKRFSYNNFNLVSVDVDLSINRLSRSRSSSNRLSISDNKNNDYDFIDSCNFGNFIFKDSAESFENFKAVSPWENLTNPQLKYYEFTNAVALGLFDYLRKSKTNGFVLSLSGGADSSSVAILVSEMVRLGIAELGIREFGWSLKDTNLPNIDSDKFDNNFNSIKNHILNNILTCIYQRTENSSDSTENFAKDLCLSLGCKFYKFNIQNIIDNYINMVQENAVDHKLSWDTDNIALQNIQARVRGPGAWMVANIEKKLLLTTGNRSEIAVGYTTMDGDTCGSLNPIGGIDKDFLLSWLNFISTISNTYKIAGSIASKKPTAELKPPSEEQTDEKDLMPYKLLNEIEKYAIRDKRSPLEIYYLKEPEFSNLEDGVEYKDKAKELADNIKKFFNLWTKNQWKRERYAPSFHLDDESLDPKTWCRFPILCGNFEEELEELELILNGL